MSAFTVSTARSGQYLCEVFYLQGTGETPARYAWWIDGKPHKFPIVGAAALTDAVSASFGSRVEVKPQGARA